MSAFYKKTRKYILSCYDFKSLNMVSDEVYDAYNVGELTDKEYFKLAKLIDCIVEKGIKYIKIGL